MKTIVITRKLWGEHYLRHPDPNIDKRCCLGFACEVYGVPAKDTKGNSFPGSLGPNVKNRDKVPKWLLDSRRDSDSRRAATINDNSNLTMDQKEEQLIPIFKKHNIKLIFRGKP